MLEELEYEHEKQKKVEDLEKQKKKNLKSLENQNKILLDQEEPTTIFWQTYILHDESGVVKPTLWLSLLHQKENIFSEFTIFY